MGERFEIRLVSKNSDYTAVKKCVTTGFFFNAARLCSDKMYQNIKTPMITHIHPSSGLSNINPTYVIYHELILTSRAYMRYVIDIEPDWLIEIAPYCYKQNDLKLN